MNKQIQVALGFREGQNVSNWRSEQLVQGEEDISIETWKMTSTGYAESKRMNRTKLMPKCI